MKKLFYLTLSFFSFFIVYKPLSARAPASTLIDSYGAYVAAVAAGTLDSAGLSIRAFMDPNLPDWNQIYKDIKFDLSLQNCRTLDCQGEGPYERDMAFITGGYLSAGNQFHVLPNKESFQLRQKLFDEARESIYIMVWSLYDDETGLEFTRQMLRALERNPEMDIRIIVDGNVATLMGHRKYLKDLVRLSDGRIKVLRWKTHKYRANGTHRKMIIVDKQHLITGGMNIGNSYANFAGAPQWRDLDIYIEGNEAGETAFNQFVSIWNSHDSKDPELQVEKMKPGELVEEPKAPVPLIFVDQHPGSTHKKAHMGLHTAVVKLLRNAKYTVDIENAYFIMDPVLEEEIKAAVKRGVKIRIFTNSKDSIDMAIVANPIVDSAKKAAKWGVEVYLKKGATLHSKYMIVDGTISMVGSFNFHPRSLRFDGENAVIITDQHFAGELLSYFEKGINEQADKVYSISLLKVAWNFTAAFIHFFYFDFL